MTAQPSAVILASTQPQPAARTACRVRTLVFDCVRQLLLWPGLAEPGSRPVLRALLAAFHKSGPQMLEEGGSGPQASLNPSGLFCCLARLPRSAALAQLLPGGTRCAASKANPGGAPPAAAVRALPPGRMPLSDTASCLCLAGQEWDAMQAIKPCATHFMAQVSRKSTT